MTFYGQVDYYQKNNFNPVPISLDTEEELITHIQKRQNLYERHLSIPFIALKDRSVLEIGCNSGETALVHALMGANLTLIEPNSQVLPNLKALFKKFKVENKIVSLFNAYLEDVKISSLYDIVVAEGFLDNLPNRNAMLNKISDLLVPDGIAVISFNDIFGSLIELTKRIVLWRICQLAGIGNFISDESLKIAKQLFEEDFKRINASRTFEAWWMDSLVYPLPSSNFWSYQEIFDVLDNTNLEFYASSPKWASTDSFNWYKDIPERSERNQRLKEEWKKFLPFFLTGFRPGIAPNIIPDEKIIDSVRVFNEEIVDVTKTMETNFDPVVYPDVLDDYFQESEDSRLIEFNFEMKQLFDALHSTSQDLVAVYHRMTCLRRLWGNAYHYVSMKKRSAVLSQRKVKP